MPKQFGTPFRARIGFRLAMGTFVLARWRTAYFLSGFIGQE